MNLVSLLKFQYVSIYNQFTLLVEIVISKGKGGCIFKQYMKAKISFKVFCGSVW